MHHEQQAEVSRARTLLSRTAIRRNPSSDTSQDVKGPLGLNTLYEPESGPSNADLIFVHGLAGGSRSTWTRSGDPDLYWPEKWLPKDGAFQNVRIHSFGYDSNWDKESILGIYDFANKLLSSIANSPTIPRDSKIPIVFVGHSMGGLVIKRAYLLAKGGPEFEPLVSRIQAMFFLATPHLGSDMAHTLTKILSLGGGARPFVNDLHRNSLAIQSINDEFPKVCQGLQLYSFYETVPTNIIGFKKTLIVEKDLAVMGYPNERREYLNANHREVCKYLSTDDPNYRTVRNALASVLNVLRNSLVSSKQDVKNHQKRLLVKLLGVSDAPEDDFMAADSSRMKGSCDWLLSKSNFQDWLYRDTSPIYFVSAKPATGKTILSGRVIAHLRSLERNCSFFFFKYGKKEKSNITSFLLSMAWQMALADETVLATCLEICDIDDQLVKSDFRTIWRKLFLEGILKIDFQQTHYWVIDALDECKSEADITPLLMKVAEVSPIRVFLTSRNSFESSQKLSLSKVQAILEEIQEVDSKSDIALYLDANMDDLPSVDEHSRQDIVDQIIKKSRGCFLWVRLVLQVLTKVRMSTEVYKILDEIPADMNELYARILDSMSAVPYGKTLAKAILIWTVCSARPLKTFELHEALQLDLKDSIDSVEASIRSCCGQLVYVDAQDQVQMIHLTARDFLLHSNTDSEFAINEKEGHRRLLLTCLQQLNGDSTKGPRRRRYAASSAPKTPSLFASYACESLPEHIVHLTWDDKDVLLSLAKFFNSASVLPWIEHIAKHSDLQRLIQTGKALSTFLEGSSTASSEFTKELTLLNSWATDLIRLVMRFGNDLEAYPSSIYHLIPPFCPPSTALRKQFGLAVSSISVRGLSAVSWDDCLSNIVNTEETYSSLASSKTQFAIGCFSGKILLFNQLTCQEVGSIHHEEPVRILSFGEGGNILVSAGSKVIRIWNLSSKSQMWKFDAPQQCMSLTLTEQNQFLLAALKDHHLKVWDLNDGTMVEDIDWTKGLEEMTTRLYRRPVTAAFGPEVDLLAIIYKGQDILLWDLENESLYGIYGRESGAYEGSGRPYGSAGVRCLVFGSGVNAHLLAAVYGDGELVLFDTSTGEVKKRAVAFAHTITCSADGSILAAGDPSGSIQLFKLDTLQLLYRINPVEPGIQGLSFSGDGARVLDIRGSRCRVWGPTVLVGRDAESRDVEITSVPPLEIKPGFAEDVILITSVACHDSGEVLFVGKEDGSVYLYDIRTGLEIRKIFSHAHGVAIVSLNFEDQNQTLCSTDSSSRIMIHKLVHQNQSIEATDVLFDHRADMAVGQLVCDSGLNHILISSESTDMLWLISKDENKLIATNHYQDRGPYRWANHPANSEHLILVTHTELHIFEWKTLKALTRPEGILLSDAILPGLSVRTIMPCFNGSILAAMFTESNRRLSKSKVLLWNVSDLKPESETVLTAPGYLDLADKVELLIGIAGADHEHMERLVFLHEGNWVCTADSASARSNHLVQHFFFPTEWLSTNLDLIIEVTKKGDIILVKRDEVAVVRKGLTGNNALVSQNPPRYKAH
ncbi:hypothetical protein F5884DRAFT_801489 [Xylogone sp. PMI_703]|nr:hypothetical protein F5884DRAFT_801489 [Xylogone sp. PMI_703]